MSASIKIGFLGAGRMASALAKGFVQGGIVPADQILASDPLKEAREAFTSATGARTTASNLEVAEFAKVLLLAVKPDQARALAEEIRRVFTPEHLLISIAAGVRLSVIEEALGGRSRVIRVMPNTPALVGASAAAFSRGAQATVEDGALVHRLFSSVGVSFEVKEGLLDAVTGLSGSGPAYVALMIEALSDGGVACGLPREVATRLAAQTVLGTAKMALETDLHPGVLKDMVTSPGGTTIEGIHELEKGGFRAAVMNAVRAAAEKSKRLG